MPNLLSLVRDQYASLEIPAPPRDITDATYVVTGANTGLGFECAKHLFQMNAGRVILAVRSREKGEAALATIRKETGRQNTGEVWELDLTSPDSVEFFAKRLRSLHRLDALIANAGVVMGDFQLVEGLETSLLVNVVTTMLLAFRVLPKLVESARSLGTYTRLVVVTSDSALEDNMRMRVKRLQGDVFEALSSQNGFSTLLQYPTTKLLQVYAIRELASRLPVAESGVIVNLVNPGLCYSNLDRNSSLMIKIGLVTARLLLARSTEKGSRNFLHAAFAGPDSHGAYCSECQVKDHVVPDWITNEDGKRTQERVWNDLMKRLRFIGHNDDIAALYGGQSTGE
ncbi:hypothetical protein NW762_012891 [Fusarium torreyae]|uniref:Uncharacterized protein n=1 Tax=Fusarium torreyae TaxID=1237075 RepID=A0A9W8RQD4_9HYPO|nr:hypothetical protein NW762_012891 [Fusarium torreyae]